MRLSLVPSTVAALSAIAILATSACSHAAPQTTTAGAAAHYDQWTSPQVKQPIGIRAPDGWIVFDDTTVTPVLDDVSIHLAAARTAFAARDHHQVAFDLRVVAAELRAEARNAGNIDKNPDQAQIALAQQTTKDMERAAAQVDAAAAALDEGRIKAPADLDRAIDKAVRANLERRWLVSDVSTWYPVSEAPQGHFTDAATEYARKDYPAAAAAIRKATSYLRLETGRATGDAATELQSATAELDKLAHSLGKGAKGEMQTMAGKFAKADHALALDHLARAAKCWANRDYDLAGYELKAAAHGLEGAAGWVGDDARAGALQTVAQIRILGNKLVSGAPWTPDEAASSFDSLGNSVNELGSKIAGAKKAMPVTEGS
jgi:hypothetical protein